MAVKSTLNSCPSSANAHAPESGEIIDLTSTAIDSPQLLRGRHSEGPSTRWDRDILASDLELLSAQVNREDAGRYGTSKSLAVWALPRPDAVGSFAP